VERVAVVPARIARQRRARLECVGDEAVVDEFEARDVVRLLERAVDRRLVAQRPHVAGVVRGDLVNGGRSGLPRPGRRDDRGQHLVIDFYQLGRVLGLGERLRDDHRDVVADIPHLALGEQRVLRLLHRLRVDVGDEPPARQSPDRVRKIGAGIDGHHARGGFRPCAIDPPDGRVRVRRAQEPRVGLPVQRYVVGVSAAAGQKAIILFALDSRADQRCTHCEPPFYRFSAAAPA
jgi:hypothetical protein